MTESAYWNPKTETLSRDDLDRLQLIKLRRVAQWAYERSPFYHRHFAAAGFHPDQLRTLADIERIPFLTRDDWMSTQSEHPPYGDLPVIGADRAIRMHTTSGTSGKTPLKALDTRKDWSWAAEMWCYALWGAGVRASDTAYVAFGYGSFIGFWGLHNGLEKIGALTIPGGAQTSANRIRQIVDFGATVVASTPTYALRLAQEAQTLGVDLANGPVRRIILSGEPTPAATKTLIEEQWGALAIDTAGMTEISTIFMFEPEDQPGGCHVIEDHFVEEVIDTTTGRRLPYGEAGERVTTSFGRSAIPLLRYRTADLVVKVPHAPTAANGRTWDLYEDGIIGRVDDMKLIRGTNVYPRAVEAIVRTFSEVDEYQVRIAREGIRDEITLLVETVESAETGWDGLRARLHKELADAHEGLSFRVERAEAHSLPRYELKARRFTDTRTA